MEFRVSQNGEPIGTVNKEWFTWGDSYKVEIVKEDMEAVMIALVIAIDCVKADDRKSS